jgi:hypothetical protein
MRSRPIMQEILIGEVEIISRLISSSASVRNIVAATPGCERMPAPMSETFPRRSFISTAKTPRSVCADEIASLVAATSSAGTENDISARPWTTFWMIVSTFTCACATRSKIIAATPGRSGIPVSVKTTSVSEWVTAEMIACSIPS